jgi:hypothetical protein
MNIGYFPSPSPFMPERTLASLDTIHSTCVVFSTRRPVETSGTSEGPNGSSARDLIGFYTIDSKVSPGCLLIHTSSLELPVGGRVGVYIL